MMSEVFGLERPASVWGLDSARVSFRATLALADVTFAATSSSITVLVGGDGAGKSTALRALVGIVQLDAGYCRRPTKESIGYVPATAGMYPDLTVAENLAFSASAYGLDGPTLRERADVVLGRIGLADARTRLGGHLSGGMQRKLAVAVALLHRPSLLVLDEPTTGVDPVSRAELWRLILSEAASGTAVVVSTTYVREAQRASTMVLLEAGRVLALGPPDAVVAGVPGAVGAMEVSAGPPTKSVHSWRRGRSWRVWAPDGMLPRSARPVAADLEDAVIVSELAELSDG